MSDHEQHVTAWLGAYHDGEVNDALRTRIETHLAICPDCQRKLDDLRQLTTLLQASPAPLSPTSDEDFARSVVSRITRPSPPLWKRGLKAVWRCAPLILFAMWAFFQAVQWMSTGLLVVLRLAPGWQFLLPFEGASGGGFLLDLLRLGLPSGLAGLAFDEMWDLLPGGSLALLNFAVMAILAVLFLSWLASWWAYNRRARLPDQLQEL